MDNTENSKPSSSPEPREATHDAPEIKADIAEPNGIRLNSPSGLRLDEWGELPCDEWEELQHITVGLAQLTGPGVSMAFGEHIPNTRRLAGAVQAWVEEGIQGVMVATLALGYDVNDVIQSSLMLWRGRDPKDALARQERAHRRMLESAAAITPGANRTDAQTVEAVTQMSAPPPEACVRCLADLWDLVRSLGLEPGETAVYALASAWDVHRAGRLGLKDPQAQCSSESDAA